MNRILIFVAAIGLACAAPSINIQGPYNETILDIHPTIGGRIVGGEIAHIEDLPYQVALLRNGGQICGGVIANSKVIITAAHCVVPSVIPQVGALNIRSGSSLHNSGGLRVAVDRIIYHSQYANLDYDIAVLHLANNAIENDMPTVAIALPENDTVFAEGEMGVVSGWGTTSESGAGSVQLRRVDVPVVSEASCRSAYGSIITERTLCAGFSNGGRDACQGDSGGPYVINGVLAGVVSFGAGCARPGYPGVYAAIVSYRDWIRNAGGV
ncbi:trypsin-3-like [Euwallacea fornicatus]|uniref:trypsin-3-like n=1 Tax=Euwallacea fornicatus TaxID=995702 RepID=UPI00338D9698